MGARGSDVPLLPEKKLTNYSTFYEIIDESKKYSDRGFYGKITPYSLLIMTRMLYKYRNNNSQWFRVATVLELIYKYFGGSMSREQYFKSNNEITIRALMDLEEFYNTDHIFMSETEMIKFKAELEFYKYDKTIADHVSILYGGSVKPNNAQEIFSKPDVSLIEILACVVTTMMSFLSKAAPSKVPDVPKNLVCTIAKDCR